MVDRDDGQDCRSVPANLTRDCIDPWTYIQFKPNGDVAPCCARPSVGNLEQSSLSSILNGPAIRQLRSELLSGKLDSFCQRCPLRNPVEPRHLRATVEEMMRGLHAPQAFNADDYLKANPDVAAAGANPAQHYLEYGRFEGRLLKLEN